MFKKVLRAFKYMALSLENERVDNQRTYRKHRKNIPASPETLKKVLREIFADCDDFILRECVLGKKHPLNICIAYIDGLVDRKIIGDNMLRPLMIEYKLIDLRDGLNGESTLGFIKNNLLSVPQIEEVEDFQQTIKDILSGHTVIYIEGEKTALKLGTKEWQSRSVEEPDTEAVVRGSREGFVETLRVNISLLRRKIKNASLKFEVFSIGEQTNTDVCICYIKGIANDSIVETVRRRLKRIKTDSILESGYIEEFIEDAPFSLLPTIGYSEKPDVVAAKILEGRVAILCNGTPFVLTVPYLFIENIQAVDDYTSKFYFATFIRCLRVFALLITSFLPALYVAVVAFHPSVIPFKLMLTMAESREGVPYSSFTEALLMLISFELLREAGIRMPRPIGQAVSIVGALVLGDAAVKSGLASNPMVIVTAITVISSFINPALYQTTSILRIISLIAANILGLMGIMIIILFLIIHMCTLRSFGVPYLSPLAPLSGMDLKDTLVRVPIWAMFTRPRGLTWGDTGKVKYRMKIDYRKKED